MARVVKEEVYAARRNAILDAAQRIIGSKGYEQMAIGDLLSELEISSGAFYHYFDSKPALLMALVERISDQIEQRVLPIIHDPELGALEKLQLLFTTIGHEKIARKTLLLAYVRVWYADENAIVRQKLYAAGVKRLTPWFREIIQQGIREKAFTTCYPDQVARMIISLLEDLGYATVELILAENHTEEDLPTLLRIMAATADALERMLGASTGSLRIASPEELSQWLFPSAGRVEEQLV